MSCPSSCFQHNSGDLPCFPGSAENLWCPSAMLFKGEIEQEPINTQHSKQCESLVSWYKQPAVQLVSETVRGPTDA